MKDLKLKIELLPKGAWNNDLSKTLPKKEWDILREYCYRKANHKCQICGLETDGLDAHEVWDFDIQTKTQTLKDIIAICTKCHGAIHFKNSVRLGYGEQAKEHFMKVNNCSEKEFASHLLNSVMEYEKLNEVFRWNMIANLNKFGEQNIKIKQVNIPKIINPYETIEWDKLNYNEIRNLFKYTKNSLIGLPKIISIEVNNYQGIIIIDSLFSDKIEWYLDGNKIKTKYNVIGRFTTRFSVKDLVGQRLYFKLSNQNGSIISKDFILENWE